MIITKKKPPEALLAMLKGFRRVALVGCGNCATACQTGGEKELEQMTWDELKNCAVTGNAVASLCVRKRGGIPAVPSRDEVEAFLHSTLA